MPIKTNPIIRCIVNIFRRVGPVGLVPLNDLIKTDIPDEYMSLGGDPYFLLNGGKPGRIMHLKIVGSSIDRRNVTLYIVSRGEVTSKDAVHVGTLLPDQRIITLDIRVPMSTRMLRLDFGIVQGNSLLTR